MNIQFMTEKNAKIIKDSWTGEDKTVYVPDFEELVKNASCQEEIDAIRETEAMLNNEKSYFKGFLFSDCIYGICKSAGIRQQDS